MLRQVIFRLRNASRKVNNRSVARGAFRRRLFVESLEDRRLLAAVRLGLFNTNTLAGNDDGSTGAVAIGFSSAINFFGPTYTNLFVNNNGNVTFGVANGTYTPSGLPAPGQLPQIAPFFADVDTSPGAPDNDVRYGTGVVNGRSAFGVNWPGVGYYSSHTDKLNKFQLVLIERFDTGPGNFDIELNYDQIQWETGDGSGESNGLGGTAAAAGFTNGSGTSGTNYQLAGSLTNTSTMAPLRATAQHLTITRSLSSSPMTTTVATIHQLATRNASTSHQSRESRQRLG